jgi:hypothetical protein
MKNLRKYCDNILYSVNAKLSGENKQIADLKTSIKTMFIGADVQHTKNNYNGNFPSIATVVASMNSQCTITNQRASRQWPNKGKQSEEAILLLKDMIEELLVGYFHGTCDTKYTTFTKSFETFRACVIVTSKTFLLLDKIYTTSCSRAVAKIPNTLRNGFLKYLILCNTASFALICAIEILMIDLDSLSSGLSESLFLKNFWTHL